MKVLVRVAAALILPVVAAGATRAAACTAADIAAAVDQSGASLRAFNGEIQPKLSDRMRRYGKAAKLSGSGYEEAALDAIQDAKLIQLDTKSSDLLLKVDTLGRIEDGAAVDCANVDQVKAASGALLVVMREKSDYMIAQLDAKIAEAGGVRETVKAAPAPKPDSQSRPAKDANDANDSKTLARPTDTPTSAASPAASNWAANTKPNDAFVPPPPAAATSLASGAVAPGADGYTIDEVREATRGFFGTISTSLASVIEHAFKQSGRPAAYVLGTEGGGAFLAGLRFGKGTLYLRNQPGTQPVYWHGPSLGTDFGASGSRTMFLIYRLRDQQDLFRSFTGVDGSAYFVGGVGITFLKGGDVLMAPIRVGLGFRVGANIGYVRFTDTPTWNPF